MERTDDKIFISHAIITIISNSTKTLLISQPVQSHETQ